jgi:hypothetical protein
MVTIREPPPGIPPSLAAGPGRAIGAAVVLAISGAAAFAVSHWPLWAVAGVLIAILLLVAALKLQFAVAILVASFYFDTYLAVGAGVVTVGKLLGALALVAWFLRWIVARQPIVASPLLWPLAGLAAWIPLSVSTAYDQAAGLSVALRYLTFFVLVFLVVQTVGEDRRTATRMLDVAVAAGAASALVGLYIFFFIANDGRAQGPLEDPNDYAFLLAVTVPLALYRIRWAAGRLHRALAFVALLAMFAAILASFSRSALVGLAVAGAWSPTSCNRSGWRAPWYRSGTWRRATSTSAWLPGRSPSSNSAVLLSWASDRATSRSGSTSSNSLLTPSWARWPPTTPTLTSSLSWARPAFACFSSTSGSPGPDSGDALQVIRSPTGCSPPLPQGSWSPWWGRCS